MWRVRPRSLTFNKSKVMCCPSLPVHHWIMVAWSKYNVRKLWYFSMRWSILELLVDHLACISYHQSIRRYCHLMLIRTLYGRSISWLSTKFASNWKILVFPNSAFLWKIALFRSKNDCIEWSSTKSDDYKMIIGMFAA